jgi:phosphatidylglycerophosphate synthase
VTLCRAALIAGVTALAGDGVSAALAGAPPAPAARAALVGLAAAALALDAVDGAVARRTGTASPLGARFDMECDAFLILALSAQASTILGAWVLAIGGMRYGYAAAGLAAHWLRGPVPPSRARKAVAAAQGVALTAVCADVLPRPVSAAAAGAALAALCWSFGRDIAHQWRQRPDPA